MKHSQKEIWTIRKKEQAVMLNYIGELNASEEWIDIFTVLYLDRWFRGIDLDRLAQMQAIADIDSAAVKWLAQQDKRAGLTMLERLSVEVTEEEARAKAAQSIIVEGMKQSSRTLDLIFAEARGSRNLFDVEEAGHE